MAENNDVVDETTDVGASQFEQLVVFELDNESYGVDISAISTIIRMQEITRIPKSPDFVEGVINLRGAIIPVIELRKRFGLSEGKITKSSRIVVVEVAGHMTGMVVDAVVETLRLAPDAIEPPSPVVTSLDAMYVRGVGKNENRLVILLDADKVLGAAEVEALAEIERDGSPAKQAYSRKAA